MINYQSNLNSVLSSMSRAEKVAVKKGAEHVRGLTVTYSRKRTGDTARSFTTQVTAEGNTPKAVVGSNEDNAIYEEYGTGIYAENGGRKTPWKYRDKKTGKWYLTRGKHGTKAFRTAGEGHKSEVLNIMANAMRGQIR